MTNDTSLSSRYIPGSTLLSSWWSDPDTTPSLVKARSTLFDPTDDYASANVTSTWKSKALIAGAIAAGTLTLEAGLGWYDNQRIRSRIRSMSPSELGELAASVLDNTSSDGETLSSAISSVASDESVSTWASRLQLAAKELQRDREACEAARDTCSAVGTRLSKLSRVMLSAKGKFTQSDWAEWDDYLKSTMAERRAAGREARAMERRCGRTAERFRGALEEAPGSMLGYVNEWSRGGSWGTKSSR